jgi:hypothetical protein
MLCGAVAGGCGQAEALEELRVMLFELARELLELAQTLCGAVAGGCVQAEALEEHRAMLFELGQALCSTVAGGCVRAKALEEHRAMLLELVEDLREFGQTLCSTVAGGCAQAEALEEHRAMLFELMEDLEELGQTLCSTVAGGCVQAEAADEFGEVPFELVESTTGERFTGRDGEKEGPGSAANPLLSPPLLSSLFPTLHSDGPTAKRPSSFADSNHAPAVERDAVAADGGGEGGVVRHDDDDGAALDLFADDAHEAFGGRGVEARRRLVQKKQARPVNERAREGHALALAARVGPHGALREGPEVEARDRVCHGRLRVEAVQARGELHVLSAGELSVAERFVADPAKGAPDVASRASEHAVVDLAGRGPRERAEDREERRLSRPVRPHDERGSPRLEPGAHPHERPHRSERLRHRAKLDARQVRFGGAFLRDRLHDLLGSTDFPALFIKDGPWRACYSLRP